MLTMNRPEARNALNIGLIQGLYTALCDADADPAVQAVVLTGVDPAFCAGVDLKEAQREGMSYFERYRTHNCITRVAEMATPVIGAINGPCSPEDSKWRWAATFWWHPNVPCLPTPMYASASCPVGE
ncbi:enoyl-CoA hydrolase [Mycobacterium xenopi 4042]|uniref:Enoyl-CoA hydralase n=1 Tax=Mycobacterium xenopi 4042 TaxID=1299334 RepID=X7Z2X5_MYCXE|nr:enoyl-CoA hydrolase [Mycobacterium xenopi 4042]